MFRMRRPSACCWASSFDKSNSRLIRRCRGLSLSPPSSEPDLEATDRELLRLLERDLLLREFDVVVAVVVARGLLRGRLPPTVGLGGTPVGDGGGGGAGGDGGN